MNTYLSLWEKSFLQHRSYLISFAFRLTGSLSEAEDLVQDTLMECVDVDPAGVHNHKSWLTKVCSNKAIDHLRSAYKRRETYPGIWLPDAIPFDEAKSPESEFISNESISMSFLLLLEKLSPEERVIYLLAEIFEFSYREIADFVNKSEEACRKVSQRARTAMSSGKKKFETNVEELNLLLNRFFEAARAGDASRLVDMLSDKAEFQSDGGGKVSAVGKVLHDRISIAKFFASPIMRSVYSSKEIKMDYRTVNGNPGMVISRQQADGSWMFETIISMEFENNKISGIYAQRNPDKLNSLLRF